jgi:hypothetical protein
VRDSGIGAWAEALAKEEHRFGGVHDFRRTTCEFDGSRGVVSEDQIPEDQYVLFDLGSDSLLEPITDSSGSFRVTQYNPTHMVRTHGPGRHQYLVTRAAIDADVVINLPKLKTHKKAGVTCALKNLIGINGNKEYLPHHRVGGPVAGGDCYPGRSRIKQALEYAFDRLNQADSERTRLFWQKMTGALERILSATGDRLGVEGSWHGNDTIWRTCLDLNRILLYGRPDGSLAGEPQRVVIHVVDAVIGGHGDGPLAAQPLPLRLLLAARNAAAVDWVAAQLLGYDPQRIPIAREAFQGGLWPLTSFRATEVRLLGDLGDGDASELLRAYQPPSGMKYPPGWEPAVEVRQEDA